MNRQPLQRALFAPAGLRSFLGTAQSSSALIGWQQWQQRQQRQQRTVSSAVPRVARPSFWQSLVPKFLRSSRRDDDPFFMEEKRKKKRSREWNPATFFIVIFLLIGSMSIQMIALKKEFATFIRRSDVRIGLLREVVEKLQRGEKVDVEAALGTGNPEREAEWDDVLKEIEREDALKKRQQSQREQSPAPIAKAAPAPAEPPEAEAQATESTKGVFY